MADSAVPPNLMGYLFAKDVLRQSLRLGLAGAWRVTHPEVIDSLAKLADKCPTLVNSFLPLPEQKLEQLYEKKRDLREDEDHIFLYVSQKGWRLQSEISTYYRLSPRSKPGALGPRSSFLEQLDRAYDIDYRLRRVIDWGMRCLQWKGLVAYSDK